MKITILSAAYPLRGGIADFAGMLYKELSKEHNVNVVTFKRQYPSLFFPGKSQVEPEGKIDKIPTSVEMDSINPLNWIKIGIKIKSEEPDLLIFKYWMPFFGPCFGTIAKIVKKNKKTKILVVCHNIIPHEKKPGDKIFTKYLFSSADYFVLMSKSVQDDLLTLNPKAKHKLLFHPVYSNFGESVLKEEARHYLKLSAGKIILFFGFIRDYKGLDILLKAVSILKSKLELKIIIAGEFYSNEEKYISLINDLKINNIVHLFSDFIPKDEVKYFFSAADVVVLPYKDATQSGIVQIANNFEKPIISTQVGGLGEVIKNGETGYLVEKENPEKLAEAILKFYDEDKEKEFSINIRKESDKFSWEKFVNGMLELINN